MFKIVPIFIIIFFILGIYSWAYAGSMNPAPWYIMGNTITFFMLALSSFIYFTYLMSKEDEKRKLDKRNK